MKPPSLVNVPSLLHAGSRVNAKYVIGLRSEESHNILPTTHGIKGLS